MIPVPGVRFLNKGKYLFKIKIQSHSQYLQSWILCVIMKFMCEFYLSLIIHRYQGKWREIWFLANVWFPFAVHYWDTSILTTHFKILSLS